jgi:hypothetical protein
MADHPKGLENSPVPHGSTFWPGGKMSASMSDGRCKGDSVAVDFKIITFSGGGGRLLYVGLSCIEITHEFPEFAYFT